MGTGWSEDLSYDYFSRIVKTLQEQFVLLQMGDAPTRVARDEPYAIVRHDLDVCPHRGLRMAQLEHSLGLQSTYMMLLDSPFYDVDSAASRAAIQEIGNLGHEVGLHFDIDSYPPGQVWDAATLDKCVAESADRLSQVSGLPVRSFSFHRPIPEFLRGETYIGGLVNSYATDLMDWYISDSKGNWREGEPLPQLLPPKGPLLQILIHPIWWGPEPLAPEDRLEIFRNELCAITPGADYAKVGQLIYDVLVVRPRPALSH